MRGILLNILYKVTPDGWIGFMGVIIGALILALSIMVSIWLNNRPIRQQRRQNNQVYYNALLESLPSYDSIFTQADYLNEDDGLLGGFCLPEGRLKILEQRLLAPTYTNDEKTVLEYKIKRQKEYLTYWWKAKQKIESLKNDSWYNVVKSNCSRNVIICYYDFIIAFDNEYFYCGPIIDTNLLQSKLARLIEAINADK